MIIVICCQMIYLLYITCTCSPPIVSSEGINNSFLFFQNPLASSVVHANHTLSHPGCWFSMSKADMASRYMRRKLRRGKSHPQFLIRLTREKTKNAYLQSQKQSRAMIAGAAHQLHLRRRRIPRFRKTRSPLQIKPPLVGRQCFHSRLLLSLCLVLGSQSRHSLDLDFHRMPPVHHT